MGTKIFGPNHSDPTKATQNNDAVVSDEGALRVTLTGEDASDGTGEVNLSAERDVNGFGILRVIDAAPWAYDPTTQALKTSIGSALPAGTNKIGSVDATLTGSNLTGSTPLPVAGTDGTTLKVPFVSSAGDNAALNTTSAAGMLNFSLGYAYNEGRYDRWRNNTEGTLLVSAARTATTNSPDITNYNASRITVFLNVTAASGTGGLTVYVQAKDPVSGGYFDLYSSPAAKTATGVHTYQVYPGATTLNAALSRTLRVRVAHGDGSSYTYSVGYALSV